MSFILALNHPVILLICQIQNKNYFRIQKEKKILSRTWALLILQTFTSPTSQFILQPFRCYTYVTAHSPNLLSLLLSHRLFTYVTWRAAHGPGPGLEPGSLAVCAGVLIIELYGTNTDQTRSTGQLSWIPQWLELGCRVRISVTPCGFVVDEMWSFSGFLPFSPTTNFIPPFLHNYLIRFFRIISFHQPLWRCDRRGQLASLLFTDL